jgi:hypothetical protein
MPGYTISEAARLCGVNRRTLQRAIQAGRLLLTVEHLVDIADLRRAGYSVPVSQLDTAPMPQHAAPAAHEVRHAAVTPQDTPQELPLVTALLAHLEQLTRTIVALHQEVILLREDLRQTPQGRRSFAPHDLRHTAGEPQGDAAPVPRHDALTPQDAPHYVTPPPLVEPRDDAPVPHHDALTPQEPPQPVTPVAAVPQGDAAPVPHHTTLTPQDTAPVAAMPRGSEATPAGVETLPPYIQRVAEVAAEYDKLSLSELAQLLYDRGIYRARDRKTGSEKPANRGTLQRWLDQARQAGVL